jgi:hypothetical protein
MTLFMEDKMDIELYDFPTMKDGRIAVEEAYCHLINAYRNGDPLKPEMLDWMDTANTWLMTTGTKL